MITIYLKQYNKIIRNAEFRSELAHLIFKQIPQRFDYFFKIYAIR